MYKYLLAVLVTVIATDARSQTFLPGSYLGYGYHSNPANNIHFSDSLTQKKWSLNKYSGISTTFSFFRGGNAMVVSAPLGLQLNRKLTDNIYAFAGVSIAPSYINLRSSFMNPAFAKGNANNFNSAAFGAYSRAELGLMYVNDAQTFSISGSIGVSNYSGAPFLGQFDRANQNHTLIYNKK